jgi:hypothetical protein
LSYASSGDGGTLTVTSGGDSMSVTLFGQYMAAGFELNSDGNGGTMITYGSTSEGASIHVVTPPAHLVMQPPSQRVNSV